MKKVVKFVFLDAPVAVVWFIWWAVIATLAVASVHFILYTLVRTIKMAWVSA